MFIEGHIYLDMTCRPHQTYIKCVRTQIHCHNLKAPRLEADNLNLCMLFQVGPIYVIPISWAESRYHTEGYQVNIINRTCHHELCLLQAMSLLHIYVLWSNDFFWEQTFLLLNENMWATWQQENLNIIL